MKLDRRVKLCQIEIGKNPNPDNFFFWHREKWLDFMALYPDELIIGGSHDNQFDKWLEKQVLNEKED